LSDENEIAEAEKATKEDDTSKRISESRDVQKERMTDND
jgi:hypothetical protein